MAKKQRFIFQTLLPPDEITNRMQRFTKPLTLYSSGSPWFFATINGTDIFLERRSSTYEYKSSPRTKYTITTSPDPTGKTRIEITVDSKSYYVYHAELIAGFAFAIVVIFLISFDSKSISESLKTIGIELLVLTIVAIAIFYINKIGLKTEINQDFELLAKLLELKQ